MTNDLINGAFEATGAVLLWGNVRQLHRDKEVKGVRMEPTLFFACWGLWNLFYYPSLGQWFSFLGGLAIVAVNVVWLAQMLWYAKVKPLWGFVDFWGGPRVR